MPDNDASKPQIGRKSIVRSPVVASNGATVAGNALIGDGNTAAVASNALTVTVTIAAANGNNKTVAVTIPAVAGNSGSVAGNTVSANITFTRRAHTSVRKKDIDT